MRLSPLAEKIRDLTDAVAACSCESTVVRSVVIDGKAALVVTGDDGLAGFFEIGPATEFCGARGEAVEYAARQAIACRIRAESEAAQLVERAITEVLSAIA